MQQKEDPATVSAVRPPTILLLEEDAASRHRLTVQLQLLHYGVTQLASLEDALRVRVPPRTVAALLGVRAVSARLTEAIQRLDEFCPVIVLTEFETAGQTPPAGAAGILLQPVAPAHLSDALDRVIESRAARNINAFMENPDMNPHKHSPELSDEVRSKSFTLSFDSMPTMEQVKDAYIERMLAAHGGNREAAARAMGISARNLYRHIADKRASRAAAANMQAAKQELV